MAYTKSRAAWPDTEGGTLIRGSDLENIEDGIDAAHGLAENVTIAALPAGSTLTVLYNAGWPARPTARTDIAVEWLDPTGASAPGGTLTDVPTGMESMDTVRVKVS
jgi:hypothetical protein